MGVYLIFCYGINNILGVFVFWQSFFKNILEFFDKFEVNYGINYIVQEKYKNSDKMIVVYLEYFIEFKC